MNIRFALLSVALFTAPVLLADCTPEVGALAPPDLNKAAQEDKAAGLPGTQACAAAQLEPGISVVAYTAGSIGAVRVIKTGTPSTVLYDVPYKIIGGFHPSVQLLDVDGDGVKEAVVSFTAPRGTSNDSIFRWTGTELRLISPSESDPDGNPQSLLTNASFVDLSGDGKLAVVDGKSTPRVHYADGSSSSERIDTLYRITNGSYAAGEPLVLFRQFNRSKGAPTTQEETFDGGGGCTTSMIVTNGGADKSGRVSSAMITVNSAAVVRPEQFNQNVAAIAVPVTIAAGANSLSVKIAGAPDGRIAIVIPACK